MKNYASLLQSARKTATIYLTMNLYSFFTYDYSIQKPVRAWLLVRSLGNVVLGKAGENCRPKPSAIFINPVKPFPSGFYSVIVNAHRELAFTK